MASLLPAVHGGAPILAMSGGGMSGGMSGGMVTLLPAAPPVHIAGMHGGASLLPVAPDISIPGMHGGVDLYAIPYGTIHNNSVDSSIVTSFGIVNTFSHSETALPTKPPCALITKTATPLCSILQPFVDRRVQALLNRVRFLSGPTKMDMGCGTIERKGTQLTISFHEKAITLLSCDLTGTFAKFHEGLPRLPSPVKNNGVKGTPGLLSWMLGSPVKEEGMFDLITFMDRMKEGDPSILPLKGFRQFLSYHKENVGDMDVLRYAMELYGYRTGAIANTNVYGLILSPTSAVRRVDTKFSIYTDGTVTSGDWNASWNSSAGFAVFEPTDAPVVSATGAATGASAVSMKASSAASTSSASIASSPSTSSAVSTASSAAKAAADAASVAAASAKKTTATNEEKKKQVALNAVFAAHLQAQYNALVKTKNDTTESGKDFSGIKNETTVVVNDYHLIDPHDNNPYYLRGVIHHGGGDNNGHYVYYYRTPGQENDWIRFSDTDIGQPSKRSIDPNVDVLNKGYIYLFERDGSSDGINRGIANHGNSCWMNAALQMFYHITEYRKYVEAFNYDTSMLPKEIKEITLSLQQIFQRYSSETDPSITCPNEYKTLVQAAFGNKSIKSQQDAMEFITKVLLGIISPPDHGTFLENDPRAPVYSLFRLDYNSNIECPDPYAFSSTPGQMPMLILPVPEREVTLDTLLHQYSASYPAEAHTKVGGKECAHPQKQIRFNIHSGHKYVILQLSRFT